MALRRPEPVRAFSTPSRKAARSRGRRGFADAQRVVDRFACYDRSRINLIDLMPRLTELRVFDNSADADPRAGRRPEPVLILHLERGRIRRMVDLADTPQWARPVLAAPLKLAK